jgi:transposase-like protein
MPNRAKPHLAIGQIWCQSSERIVAFFAFALSIRKVICTTNALQALHRSPQGHQYRGHFPNDDAAIKVLSPSKMPASMTAGVERSAR